MDTYSWTTDTPDFWRREYMHYPRHGGRFTGEPAYFRTTMGSAKGMMEKAGLEPEDFAYAIFHQPNGKFPMRVGKKLGFTQEQLETGWLSPWLGNTYSGASPIGLTAVLDIAKPGDLILITSFGSGAGSDSFVFRVTDRIERGPGPGAQDPAAARRKPDLPGLRHLRQAPRQDPHGRVRRWRCET